MDKNARKLVISFAALLALAVVALLLLFNTFIGRYRTDIASESAEHLVEINHQAGAYIKETLSTDKDLATSIAISIDETGSPDEAALLSYLSAQKDTWGVDSIRVYDEAGLCLDQDGVALNNDQASKTVYETEQSGSLFTISKSTIEYSVAVDSKQTIHGNPVAVVSVVSSLDTLIDNMGIETFGGQSSLYLTRQDGVKVSQSSNAQQAYNVSALFESGTLECLTEKGLALKDAWATGTDQVFLHTDGDAIDYVVMTPVDALGETWYLFYIVPEATVNMTMNSFTSYVMQLAASIMIAFFALIVAFYLIFRIRSRRYTRDIDMRERLMDMLVSQTGNAFMILSKDRSTPEYQSSNASDALGGASVCTDTQTGRFFISNSGEIDPSDLEAVNSALEQWDGTREFVSDYLPSGEGQDKRYVTIRLYPAKADGGEYVGIVADVTREREREEQMRSALVLADSANRAKTEFLSQMSHDIRTPMNAITNMTLFAIRDVADPEKTLGYLEVIKDSSEHLLQLVNNVLDMSRIESGKLSFSSEPFDLREVANETGEIIKPLCDSRFQDFDLEFDAVHENLIGDSLRLNQILINLLNNATKFTPEHGHVSLKVSEQHSLKPGYATFRFDVADDGIGMDEETANRIFAPFARADTDTVHGIEGSGLGLSIAKNFVEAMGGTISLQTALGKGSTFSVELFFPIDTSMRESKETPARKTDTSQISFDGKHALLAEDNEINSLIATQILERKGFAVDTVPDGKQAVEAFTGHAPGTYDVIFLDIQMPVMDGYAASRAIRASHTSDAETIPIIAMTANVFAEDVERARQAGMSGHVGKPIDPDTLYEETARHLSQE